MSITKRLIGDTIKVTWVDSGVVPSSIYGALLTSSETLVSSVAMTDSGNGHYFAEFTLPNSRGVYVAESEAVVGGKPFKNRLFIKAITGEAT